MHRFGLLLTIGVGAILFSQPKGVSFKGQVQPLLKRRCVVCHGEKKAESGLRLDSYEAILRGGKSGPVVVPGHSEKSLLFLLVSGRKEPKMPPDPFPPLTDPEIRLLKRWIEEGAKNDAPHPSPQKQLLPPPPPSAPKFGDPPRPQQLTLPVTVTVNGRTQRVTATVEFGPTPPISALAFHPNGRWLFVGGYKEVIVWDFDEAKLLSRRTIEGLYGSITDLSVSPDGKFLVIGGGVPHHSGVVAVLDGASGQVLARFVDMDDLVYAVAIDPKGKLIAAGGAFKGVRVWDREKGRLVATLQGHSDWVMGVAFSPDGKWLATGGVDKTVLLWTVGPWDQVRKLSHPEPVFRLLFHPDGKRLAVCVSGASERSVWIWNVQTGKRQRVIGTGKSRVLSAAWHPDGKLLAVSFSDGTVRLYDERGHLKATLERHPDWVTAIAFHPDGNRIASGGSEGTVRVWDDVGNFLAVLVHVRPGRDDWLILTPQGYFVASDPARLRWKGLPETFTPDRIRQEREKPERVQEALKGRGNP